MASPRVTLVTGCSSGIGLSIAVKLAQDPKKSFRVYATMRNLAKKGDLEKAAGSTLNSTLFILKLDINEEEQIVSVVKEIMKRDGRIDVLVNNAAFGHFGIFEEMSMAHMKSMIDTNTLGTFRLTQEVIRCMKVRRSGRIVNISSITGIIGLPYANVYAATKFALEGLSETLYPELRSFNIWISTISPGPVKTNFLDKMEATQDVAPSSADPKSPSGKLMGAYYGKTWDALLERYQSGEDVANVVLKCLSSAEPLLRYPTSGWVDGYMKERFVDGVGSTAAKNFFEVMKSVSK
ncbi:retinol dehydrogenase 8-like [Diadema antillarum]|uniref:retinol dehydrogenase 8-like n=2 Tax=Diadema antillarum TaxID=105358 RepID=UPI003A8ACBD3